MKKIYTITILLESLVLGTCFFIYYKHLYIFLSLFVAIIIGNYYYDRSRQTIIKTIFFSAMHYGWCFFIQHSYDRDIKIIESYNCCNGTIVDKKEKINDDFYKYTIKTYNVFNNNNNHYQNKKISSYIIIKSKQSYNIGDFCTFKYIHWFSNNDYEIKLKYFSKSIIAYGTCKFVYCNEKHNWFKTIFVYPAQLLYDKKQSIIKEAKKILDPKTYYFFSAIVLGNVDYENNEFDTLCKQWGIMHYLARSGLHVTIIIQCIMSFLTLLGISYYRALILGLLFLGFFYCISITSLPFQRACVTYVLNCISIYLKRNIPIVHIFSLCTIFFFIYNPFFIVNLGFQLSFLITGLLLIIKK